jgi:hypothetical protein
MMVRVVMSSATRVPEMSLLLSTLLRQPTTYRGPLLALTMTARGARARESAGQLGDAFLRCCSSQPHSGPAAGLNDFGLLSTSAWAERLQVQC